MDLIVLQEIQIKTAIDKGTSEIEIRKSWEKI